MSYYLRDETGQTANVPLYVNIEDDQNVADVFEELISTGTLINNITGCAIYEATCGVYAPQVFAWRPRPAIGSRCSFGALFKFGTNIATWHYGITIPAILESKLIGHRVNVSDPDIAAFINIMTDTGRPYVYSTKEGAELDSFVSSFLNVRKPPPAQRTQVSPT